MALSGQLNAKRCALNSIQIKGFTRYNPRLSGKRINITFRLFSIVEPDERIQLEFCFCANAHLARSQVISGPELDPVDPVCDRRQK